MHTSPSATILRLFPLSPRWKENCRKVECKGEGGNACQLPIRVKLIYSIFQVRAEFSDKMKLKFGEKKSLALFYYQIGQLGKNELEMERTSHQPHIFKHER